MSTFLTYFNNFANLIFILHTKWQHFWQKGPFVCQIFACDKYFFVSIFSKITFLWPTQNTNCIIKEYNRQRMTLLHILTKTGLFSGFFEASFVFCFWQCHHIDKVNRPQKWAFQLMWVWISKLLGLKLISLWWLIHKTSQLW